MVQAPCLADTHCTASLPRVAAQGINKIEGCRYVQQPSFITTPISTASTTASTTITTMSTPLKSMKAVGEYQPVPMSPMDVKEAPSSPRACQGTRQQRGQRRECEGCYCHCECKLRDPNQQEQQQEGPEHSDCHRKRLRRATHFSFAGVLVLTLMLFMAFKCRLDQVVFGSPEGLHDNGGSGLEKRQSTGSNGTSNGTQSSFVKNKREFTDLFDMELS